MPKSLNSLIPGARAAPDVKREYDRDSRSSEFLDEILKARAAPPVLLRPMWRPNRDDPSAGRGGWNAAVGKTFAIELTPPAIRVGTGYKLQLRAGERAGSNQPFASAHEGGARSVNGALERADCSSRQSARIIRPSAVESAPQFSTEASFMKIGVPPNPRGETRVAPLRRSSEARRQERAARCRRRRPPAPASQTGITKPPGPRIVGSAAEAFDADVVLKVRAPSKQKPVF